MAFNRQKPTTADGFINAGSNSIDPASPITPIDLANNELHKSAELSQAAYFRDVILKGYQDAINGRVVPYRGNLRRLLKSESR